MSKMESWQLQVTGQWGKVGGGAGREGKARSRKTYFLHVLGSAPQEGKHGGPPTAHTPHFAEAPALLTPSLLPHTA